MRRYACWGVMLLVWGVAGAAFGQDDVALLAQNGEETLALFDSIPSSQKFTDSATGFDDAIKLARKKAISQIWVLKGAWTAPSTTLSGLAAPLLQIRGLMSSPEDIIVLGFSGAPALQIASADVVIEGIAVKGKNTGIKIQGGSVDITRCYIQNNGASGVDATGGKVLLVNSVIADNAQDGLRVENDATVRVVHCTFLNNASAGVNSAGTVPVSLVNTILANNPGDSLTGSVTAEGCDLYNNGTDPAVLLPGPILNRDPGFGASAWQAKLDPNLQVDDKGVADEGADLQASPVYGYADTGRNYAIESYTGARRPVPLLVVRPVFVSNYDIGADEVQFLSGGALVYFIQIAPAPVGKLAAGELKIIIKVSGVFGFVSTNDPNYDTSPRFLLIPESGLPYSKADPPPIDRIIPLDVSPIGTETWYATNAEPIDTYLGSGSTAVLVDGMAQLVAVTGDGSQIPYMPGVGGAEPYSRVLIDTVPPQLYIPAGDDGLAASDFVTTPPVPAGVGPVSITASNDTLIANISGYPAPLPLLPPSVAQLTESVPASGGLVKASPTGEGAALFYNVGTVNNPSATTPENLVFSVGATFVDSPPTTKPNGSTLAAVTTSGFDPELTTKVYDGPAQAVLLNAAPDVLYLPHPPTWRFEAGYPGAIAPDDEFTGEYFLSNSKDPGKEPYNVMVARWTVVKGVTMGGSSVTGIPWERVGNTAGDPTATLRNDWHVRVRFSAEDRAGNITAQSMLLDPLDLWWLIDTDTILQPNFDQRFRPESLQFTWRLQRPASPTPPTSPADPLYTFRLYEKATEPDNPDGFYVPLNAATLSNGWRPWTTATSAGTTWFEDNGIVDNFNSRWLMMVVIGLDEAGNLQRWPFSGNPDLLYLTSNQQGSNWVRFYIEAPGQSIDTKLNATFWWDRRSAGNVDRADAGETDFGAATVVPMAPDPREEQLKAAFDLTAVAPGVNLADNARVYWELYEAGQTTGTPILQGTDAGGTPLYVNSQGRILDRQNGKPTPLVFPRGTLSALGDRVSLILKLNPAGGKLSAVNAILQSGGYPTLSSAEFDRLDRNGDGVIDKQDLVDAVQYVFQAWTVVDPGGGAPERVDPTPVNYYFTVVSQVGQYVQPQNRPEDQVFKVFER